MTRQLFRIDELMKSLEKNIGHENKFFLVSTAKYDLTTNPKGRNSRKSRSEWADETVKELFKRERSQIVKMYPRKCSTGELNFSYIKFAENTCGEVFGIVHGKSSFHCMYPSDVWFYDFNTIIKSS